jgi:hypothetical protein
VSRRAPFIPRSKTRWRPTSCGSRETGISSLPGGGQESAGEWAGCVGACPERGFRGSWGRGRLRAHGGERPLNEASGGEAAFGYRDTAGRVR